ncbi:hypothetical protein B0181_01840 [Moraxella caviae]|uniref:Type IV pilin biogenesis protein n=1 Tax=Moraxella caviae TaxID=34060 RepID=A0A1T0A9G1_9GAMM|nr:type II secretion system F family protein [Moraxella caviae]OOR92354.1 hypothetical protein B0181_01840 [Moraxella caviae]STZ10582.1 type IV pilin biogenesis protein [Moraxella caviae]VEW10963.1 type IV pilin biogenesis protein [Moraxella caviae]
MKAPNPTSKTFRYQAIDRTGKLVKGEIDAATLELARLNLQKQGLSRLIVRQKRTKLARLVRSKHSQETTLFFRKLTTLLGAGITLTHALGIIRQTTDDTRFQAVIDAIKADIESGQTFADSLARHPAKFSKLTIALVNAGETSGTLDEMLARISDYGEKSARLTQKIRQAVRYPAIVLFTAVVVTVILLAKVVPIFSEMFATMGESLPLPTRLVMALSEFVIAYGAWLLAVVIGGFALWTAGRRHAEFRTRQDGWLLRAPIIGKLVLHAINARFARTLATTFGAGITLVPAIISAGKSADNAVFERAASQIATDIQAGSRLHTAMQKANDSLGRTVFLPMTMHMVHVGEESGRLQEMLEKAAEYQEQQVDDASEHLTSLIEPVMIVVLGLLVGGLVVAMYLPIFSLGQAV